MKVTWVDDSPDVSVEVVTDGEELPFEAATPVPVVQPLYIDKSMVGKVLTRSILNITNNAWKKCYPGAFWVEWGKRMQAPATKGSCLGDIRPGERRKFEVVVPRFPTREEPDLLRVAILEDGVGWHIVEDVRVG